MKRFLLIALSAASLIASAASAQVTQPPSGSTIGTVTTVTNPVGIKGADGSGIAADANPVPVSGTVTAAQATASSLNATVVGTGTFATQATLQAGSAIAGKFGIDQTTPGTTNKVSIGTDGTVAATQSGTWNVTNVSGTVSLPTGASTAANQTATQSPVTAATATATTSALAGCRYVSTLDTFTTSQQGAVNCGTRGSLSIQLMRPDSANAVSSSSAAADGASNAQAAYFIYDLLHVFNGSTWDRAFTCANTASVNVTAGNTTQIVGLSGSTVIRVCSVSISMSAAGTVAFVTGTGTNCGTPTTIMTAMNLGTATPWAQTAPEGGSLFRSTTGGEICVTAVTGNVTGLITYAQY